MNQTEAQSKLIPIEELDGWEIDDRLRLRHCSGGFYTFQSLRYCDQTRSRRELRIVQNEIGVLLSHVIENTDDPLESLISVQSKFEPGNDPYHQLSPAIQKTYSNLKGLHGGNAVNIKDLLQSKDCSIFSASLQSEQADSYLHKKNLNVIVNIEKPEKNNTLFGRSTQWVTLRKLCSLALRDEVIHIDLRSVSFPLLLRLLNSKQTADNPTGGQEEANEIIEKATLYAVLNQRPWTYTDISDDYHLTDGEIRSRSKRDDEASIVGVHAIAPAREVPEWHQPLLKVKPKTFILIYKVLNGEIRILVSFCVSPGLMSETELSPSWVLTDAIKDEFFSSAMIETLKQFHYSVQTEEGGRFWRRYNNYAIYEGTSTQPSQDQTWLSLECLEHLYNTTNLVSIELRSACVLLLAQFLVK